MVKPLAKSETLSAGDKKQRHLLENGELEILFFYTLFSPILPSSTSSLRLSPAAQGSQLQGDSSYCRTFLISRHFDHPPGEDLLSATANVNPAKV